MRISAIQGSWNDPICVFCCLCWNRGLVAAFGLFCLPSHDHSPTIKIRHHILSWIDLNPRISRIFAWMEGNVLELFIEREDGTNRRIPWQSFWDTVCLVDDAQLSIFNSIMRDPNDDIGVLCRITLPWGYRRNAFLGSWWPEYVQKCGWEFFLQMTGQHTLFLQT